MAQAEENRPQPSQESDQQSKQGEQLPKTVTIPEAELEHLKRELHEYKDKYFRTLAESENARKRLLKEKQELIQYALQNIIVDFLNPIDHMENALTYSQNTSEEVKHWAVGFQMILTQFKDVLANHGVTHFTSIGEHFDPHLHEAIESVITSNTPPNTVIEESVKGYKMGGRTIRPARVKVSQAPAKEKKEEKLENKTEQIINGE